MAETTQKFDKTNWRFWAILGVGWFIGGAIITTAIVTQGVLPEGPLATWVPAGLAAYFCLAAPAFAAWKAMRLKRSEQQ